MIPEDVLKIVAEKLEDCGIAYMIVGSFASNIHGKPRTTHDADMVIEIDEPSLERFVQALGTDLSKLEWSKMGESERQFDDAVNIAKVQGEKLDLDYLQRWAADLQIENLLSRLLEEIKPTS